MFDSWLDLQNCLKAKLSIKLKRIPYLFSFLLQGVTFLFERMQEAYLEICPLRNSFALLPSIGDIYIQQNKAAVIGDDDPAEGPA